MNLTRPYLTEIYNKKTEEDFICLIQAVSKSYTSYYQIDNLSSIEKNKLITLAENWWRNEPTLPISIYYQKMFDQFKPYKKYIENKDCSIVQGYEGIKLKNLSEKRIKRKIIHLD